MKTIEKIFDAKTNKETIIEREMTEQEQSDLEDWTTRKEAKAKLEAENLAAKKVLLDRLGITADEAKLLLL